MSPDFLLSLDSLARLVGCGLPPGLRALLGAVEPPIGPRPAARAGA